jgi:ELWxxDGT repeat protein
MAARKQRSCRENKRIRTKLRSHRDRSRHIQLETLECRFALAGTWAGLINAPPASTTGYGTMELLSDGTVIVLGDKEQSWVKLTPDATGNYVNGTWSAIVPTSIARLYSATNVLPDGRVFDLGGEYTGPSLVRTDTNTGEIYNPVSDAWSALAPFPEATFGDCAIMLLNNGKILAGAENGPQTYLYDPTANSWSPGPTKLDNDSSLAEVWAKLADGSILSYDNWAAGGKAQRFDPVANAWVDAGFVPVALQSSTNRGGPAILLPDGRVFVVGGNSNTAIYTPPTVGDGTAGKGSWQVGPVIPNGNVGMNAAAAMLPNGKVLFAAGSAPGADGPIHFFEFDPKAPIASSLTDVSPAAALAATTQPFVTRMLMLPSGQVLTIIDGFSIYTPDGSSQSGWKPSITSISDKNNHYLLSGVQLNGLSAGSNSASSQASTNYPIVQLKNAAEDIYFARTFNWSSTGVATGNALVSTEFSLPAGMLAGGYSLTVVANGIASDPVPFTVAMAGDFNTDGQLTGADVSIMMAALPDLTTFKLAHGLTANGLLTMGDLDGDQAVNNADLQALLARLAASKSLPTGVPQMVRDINGSIATGSDPSNLTAIGNTVYFTADDGIHGTELWKSDGTAAGTVMVKDINPGAGGSSPTELANFNGILFFSADDGASGIELWKSDGTQAGTVMVKDISPGSSASEPRDFTAVGDTLFFTAADGTHGRELWKTAGTAASTVLVKDIDELPADSSDPTYLTSFQGDVYFDAWTADDGDELWKSDGTADGTVMVEDIFPGTYYNQNAKAFYGYSAYPGPFMEFQGELYFSANDGIHGFELWKTDGTKSGTVLVKDIAPGALGSAPYSSILNSGIFSLITPAGDTLFFDADDGDHGAELWKTDGTESGTVLVKDIAPGLYGAFPFNLVNVDGTLFLDAFQDGTGDVELFKSDGTEAGTVLVADINQSHFQYPAPVNGTLYFSADDGSHGTELWQSDGTSAGTRLVIDLNAGPSDSDPSYLTNANGTLFFSADDGVHGSELWTLKPSLNSSSNATAALAPSNSLASSGNLFQPANPISLAHHEGLKRRAEFGLQKSDGAPEARDEFDGQLLPAPIHIAESRHALPQHHGPFELHQITALAMNSPNDVGTAEQRIASFQTSSDQQLAAPLQPPMRLSSTGAEAAHAETSTFRRWHRLRIDFIQSPETQPENVYCDRIFAAWEAC